VSEELGALVLVDVLAVLADEDEAGDQDRLDGEDDPEEAVGIGVEDDAGDDGLGVQDYPDGGTRGRVP